MDNHNHSQVDEAQKKAKPIAPKVNELIARCKSFILATVDKEGVPNSSYAPYAELEGKFYILVSYMARHTKNLVDSQKASVMFIEDESNTKQIYARERLTVEMAVTQIENEDETWNIVVQKLRDTHGKIVDLISGMGDFIMIELQPVKGSYVNGFGSAYFVDENLEVLQHRNDVAHEIKK